MDKSLTKDQSAIYRVQDSILEAINLATGEVTWQQYIEQSGRSDFVGLIQSEDSLYLLTEITLQKYAKEDGSEIWQVEDIFRKYEVIRGGLPTFFTQDDKVFVIGSYGNRVAYDTATGKEIWKNDSDVWR